MNEIGIVENIENNLAKVRVDKKDECDKCGMCMFPKGASKVLIDAVNEVGAEVGDTVKIEVKPKAKTLGIILVFLVPLLLILISAFITFHLSKNEYLIALVSLLTLCFWYFVLAIIDKKLKKSVGFCSVITQIIEKNKII